MSESLTQLLLRLSEAGPPAILPGDLAKAHFGKQFQTFLNRRLIIEMSPAAEWSTCDRCECGLYARPVRNVDGRLVAPCPLDAASDVDLEEDDLRSFEINLAAIIAEMASASGFGSDAIEVVDGVWYLGRGPANHAIFVTPASAATRHPGLSATLRIAAQDAQITMIAPELTAPDRRRFAEAGIHCVVIQDVVGGIAGSLFALDHPRLMPASNVASRLVVDRPCQSVILDGRDIALSVRQFKLMWLLAQSATRDGHIVSPAEIEKCLWGNHVVAKGAAADPIRDLRRRLRPSRQGGVDAASVIETRQGGYVLGLAPNEISLIP